MNLQFYLINMANIAANNYKDRKTLKWHMNFRPDRPSVRRPNNTGHIEFHAEQHPMSDIYFKLCLNNLKNQNLNNWKNTWRYHFTQVYHKWQSYDVWFLRYEVWQTEFFVILDHFCPFTPLTTQKIKILKKWEKHLEILPFYTSVPKIIICYAVTEIWCVTDVVIFHFGSFFALLHP